VQDKFIYFVNTSTPANASVILDKIDWNAWLYGKGMPPVTLDFSNPSATAAN
jgi:hypothetical protein